ncbi:hypothetical protein GIB67_021884, partial [Kingdonia uniflora]
MGTEKKREEMGHESTSKDLLEFEHKLDFMSSSLESKVHYDDMNCQKSLGAKVLQPGVEVLSDDDEAFEDEEMVEFEDESNDLIESDLEVLGDDVVEPDSDPLQKVNLRKRLSILQRQFYLIRHRLLCMGPEVSHPIHDQTFYLSSDHKKKLKEFGVEPWTFAQKLGEAIFIPASCPHQVRNLM